MDAFRKTLKNETRGSYEVKADHGARLRGTCLGPGQERWPREALLLHFRPLCLQRRSIGDFTMCSPCGVRVATRVCV